MKADLPKDTTWKPVAGLAGEASGAIALIRRLVQENAGVYAGRYVLAFICMALVAAATAASA